MRHPYLWRLRAPESSVRGKRIRVTGHIGDYNSKPQIVLVDPSQLTQ
jgi:hypothetical protein